METIKSYTNIEQSKKLAEILPLESADMTYCAVTEGSREKMIIKDWEVKFGLDIAIKENLFSYRNGYMIPCWSLVALLDVLPTINDEFEPQLHRSLDKYFCTYEGEEDSSCLWRVADNPVDACYEIILKLHELKML